MGVEVGLGIADMKTRISSIRQMINKEFPTMVISDLEIELLIRTDDEHQRIIHSKEVVPNSDENCLDIKVD